MVQASSGNFYGTTGSDAASQYGAVFTMDPGGTVTTLHTFSGTDGAYPHGLIQASDGTFYGATVRGGALA